MPSYLVIARKWRPGLFEEIVGQEHVTRTLRNAIASGRVAHAYLFSGPRGVGKTTAARIFAKSLNCEKGPTPTPCNACDSCKGVSSGSSIDIFEIDGASNRNIDDIRNLRDSIRFSPAQGKYKIYIIDEVHMLTKEAFNALLKTLEEPPPHALFIFATTEVHKIPATILSRCQRFDFKRIPFRQIQEHLLRIVTQEGVKHDEKALFTIAREADGSLRDAQSLLEQVMAFGDGNVTEEHTAEALGLMKRSILFDLSDALISKDPKACLNIVENICNFGYDLKRACSGLVEHIRDLIVFKVTGDGALLELPDSELERVRELAGKAGTERLHLLFSVLSKGYEDVGKSAYPRYSFEMAILKAAHLDEIQPIADLIGKLEGFSRDRTGTGEERQHTGVAKPAPKEFSRPAPKTETVAPGEKPACGEEEPAYSTAAAPVGAEEGFLDFLRRKPALAGSLENASFEMSAHEAQITAGPEKMALLKIKSPQIQALAEEFFKRRVKVAFKEDKARADKKPEVDPIVEEARRVFKGRIIH